ncbi:MAG: hypothetical protein Q8R87_07510, partial [Anaerolineaceae bacterium]|nr:hypothetical protein [Anaerolineaceae bacterium]
KMRELLGNQYADAVLDAVILNAAGLLSAETGNFKTAIAEARETIRNGSALNKLNALVEFSRSFA